MTLASTVVKDSIVGDAWIQQTAQAVPVQRVLDENGQPTGDILTGPVRLAFCDGLMDGEGEEGSEKYGATLLFTPFADFRIFEEEYWAACGREFPNLWNGHQYSGLHSPFHDQGEKAQYKGYTPGCKFINSSSMFRPNIVDMRHNPIVDKSKIFPGVWAICGVKPYAYGKVARNDGKPTKKGIAFGLQTVMILGEDTRFGGGPADTKTMYKGMGNVTAPIVRPDLANSVPSPQPQPPAQGIPGYTAPGGGAPQPHGQPSQPFSMPQTHYQPTFPAGNVPAPGAPTAPVGPATQYPSSAYDPNDPMFQ